MEYIFGIGQEHGGDKVVCLSLHDRWITYSSRLLEKKMNPSLPLILSSLQPTPLPRQLHIPSSASLLQGEQVDEVIIPKVVVVIIMALSQRDNLRYSRRKDRISQLPLPNNPIHLSVEIITILLLLLLLLLLTQNHLALAQVLVEEGIKEYQHLVEVMEIVGEEEQIMQMQEDEVGTNVLMHTGFQFLVLTNPRHII